MLSIKASKVLPSTLLRKLSNYSRKNRLYQAFRELGRVIRTVFLLQYISDIQLREQITFGDYVIDLKHVPEPIDRNMFIAVKEENSL